MQHFVRLHTPHIVAIQQPVELLTREREDWVSAAAWPMKALLLEALVLAPTQN